MVKKVLLLLKTQKNERKCHGTPNNMLKLCKVHNNFTWTWRRDENVRQPSELSSKGGKAPAVQTGYASSFILDKAN